MAFFEIKDIKKTFSDNYQVLKGVSFTLEKGQVLSIIGSSGSGKTTLLRAINGLTDKDSGDIIVDGKKIVYDNGYPVGIDKGKTIFGLVFQNFNLFPQYTVLENITLAPKLLLKDNLKALKQSGEKINDKEWLKVEAEKIEQNALEIIKKVGLSDKLKYYPCELSGGQCQRVAIARALALKPKILCFDEPTSALDPELTGEVLKVIKSLKDSDMTMVIVTHEMEFARGISDKIIYMAHGIVEEEGTAEEIFSSPKKASTQNFLRSYFNKE